MTEPAPRTDPRPAVDALAPALDALAARHRQLGWGAVALFAALGLGLEALHGWKAALYLDAGHEQRRLLFTLAHAHGTLLGLLHLAFASAVARAGRPAVLAFAGRALGAATILLPGGFLLGGLAPAGGDPGPGVLLVPLGALALIAGTAATAWSQRPR